MNYLIFFTESCRLFTESRQLFTESRRVFAESRLYAGQVCRDEVCKAAECRIECEICWILRRLQAPEEAAQMHARGAVKPDHCPSRQRPEGPFRPFRTAILAVHSCLGFHFRWVIYNVVFV